jgi:transcriptional regulator with XRE-family HTH domain
MSGEQLKEFLRAKEMKLSDVAEAMGNSRQWLDSKLRGSDLGIGFIKQLSQAIKVPFWEIVSEPEPPPASNPSKIVDNPSIVEMLKEQTSSLLKCQSEKDGLYREIIALKDEMNMQREVIKKSHDAH